MNNELFRKVALDKLSSPEQLDQTMRVAGPMYWTSLLAILVALTAAVVWSLTGSIPTKSTGQGTIIRPGGVYNISSSGTGLVKDFKVRVGDHVSVNQVVAEIDQPLSNDDIAAADQHLAELRRQEANAVSLREEDAKLQLKSLSVQRENAKTEIVAQEKMEKIAAAPKIVRGPAAQADANSMRGILQGPWAEVGKREARPPAMRSEWKRDEKGIPAPAGMPCQPTWRSGGKPRPS